MFDGVSMKGKKVLITAGASGLGLEMAKVFSAAGSEVFICDISQPLLDDAKAQCPSLHMAIADVSEEASVATLFKQVEQELGGLDVLVNNAGIAGPTGYVETLSKQTGTRRWLSISLASFFVPVWLFPCSRSLKRVS